MTRLPPSHFAFRIAGLAILLAGAFVACNKSFDTTEIAFSVTVRVSVKSGGAESHGDALSNDRLAISNDGRYVAFASDAVDLAPNDTNLKTDVFVHDTVGGTTALVSVGLNGFSANGRSKTPSISGDGRYVCFESTADNLDVFDTNGVTSDIFVRDLQNSTTTLVSCSTGPTNLALKGNAASTGGFISANGRYVVFETVADNLDGVAGGGVDNDPAKDIYRRDWLDPGLTFKTILVSWSSDGDPNIGVPTGVKGQYLGTAQNNEISSCSADGSKVAWQSVNSNLALLVDEHGPDNNTFIDCFVRDLSIPKTYRVSFGTIAVAGTILPDCNGVCESPSISADGNVVAFHTVATNIVPEDSDPFSDIFYYNLLSGVAKIATIHTTGSQAGAGCNFPTLSADGRYVVFYSPSINLVNGDSNSADDCFMHDTLLHQTTRVSVRTFGGEANGKSQHPVISGDGRYIAFWSEATDMVDEDSNGSTDVFMRGPPR